MKLRKREKKKVFFFFSFLFFSFMQTCFVAEGCKIGKSSIESHFCREGRVLLNFLQYLLRSVQQVSKTKQTPEYPNEHTRKPQRKEKRGKKEKKERKKEKNTQLLFELLDVLAHKKGKFGFSHLFFFRDPEDNEEKK